ncbi:MAG: hypothetical protein ACTSRH_08205 [Promethearchaeota archaeon]
MEGSYESETQTQIFKNEEEDKKTYLSNPPIENILEFSTTPKEELTGEHVKPQFFLSNVINNFLVEFLQIINNLKQEIEKLKEENKEIKQKINEIYQSEEFDEIKELSNDEIEKLIIKFLKDNKNRTVYPSDIAFEYNLDAKKVFEICQKLKREGKII